MLLYDHDYASVSTLYLGKLLPPNNPQFVREWSDHTAAFHFCYKLGTDCCAGAPNVQTACIYLDVLIKSRCLWFLTVFASEKSADVFWHPQGTR
jgi:hypothetical protein